MKPAWKWKLATASGAGAVIAAAVGGPELGAILFIAAIGFLLWSLGE